MMTNKVLPVFERLVQQCYCVVKGNITENTFEILHLKDSARDKYEKLTNESGGLDGLWKAYMDAREVYPEDLADFAQYINLDFVSRFLRKYNGKEKYGMDFRCLLNGAYRLVHLEIIAAEDYTDEQQNVYMLLLGAGDKLREDYVHFNDLLCGLSENYSAIYYVDFDDNTIRPFRMSDVIERLFGGYFRTLPPYEAAINSYIEKVVSPKDKEMMREVTRYDFLKRQMSNELAYSHEYHLERNGREYVYRMKVANMEGIGPLHKAVFGFADVSMEKGNDHEMVHLGRKILIAEDDGVSRKNLFEIVKTQYEAVAVKNGQEALDYLAGHFEEIGLIITDFHMPEMNGDELIRRLKASRQYANIPIIVTMSADSYDTGKNIQTEIECLKLGATDFVFKPYNMEIILNRMKSIIRLRETTAMLDTLERDPLTGLLTKEFFFARTREYLSSHPEQKCVMWASDILGLKVVNERYGLEMGDSILQIMADDSERFHGFIYGGRIEGDKFAALILEEYLPEYLEIVKEHDMGIGFPVPGIVIKHGFYHIKTDSDLPVQGMYDRALLALQRIKDEFGVYSAEYDDALRKELLMRRQITESAVDALKKHQFEVYYQPKFDLHRGRTSGAEALIRWIHPELGFMNPGVFIAQFEQSGFIRELDIYVWEEVCRLLKSWKDENKRLIPISVNVSRRDFDDSEFEQKVVAIADRYGIEHSYLHIEITESAYSDNPEKIARVIKGFHEKGFVVELDDFGSGYSSMTALSNLDLDIMKLDMSIIQNDNPGSEKNILEFSMHLAKMMRLKTVAEGVETEEQVERITSLGGDYIQGYFYSKPLPRAQFEEYLLKERECIGKYLSFENVVKEAKKAAAAIEPALIKEALAVEFDITGAGEGIFYIHYTPEKTEAEPYEYYDRDFQVRADADSIISILSGELDLEQAMKDENVYVTGNAGKWQLLKAYIQLAGQK